MDKLTCTVKEALASLSLGRSKFYEMISDGAVDTIKIGGKRLIVIESLRRLVEGESNDRPR